MISLLQRTSALALLCHPVLAGNPLVPHVGCAAAFLQQQPSPSYSASAITYASCTAPVMV